MVTDIYLSWVDVPDDADQVSAILREALQAHPALVAGRRVTVTVCSNDPMPVHEFTFRPTVTQGLAEELVIRNMHPLTGQRLDLWRLKNFVGTREPAAEGTYLFHLIAPDNARTSGWCHWQRSATSPRYATADGTVVAFPAAERVLAACLENIRRAQARRTSTQRLDNNQVFLHVWPTVELPLSELAGFAQLNTALTFGTGLAEITVLASLREPDGSLRDAAIRFTYQAGAGLSVTVTDPPTDPLAPLDEYTQKVQRANARGTTYPYEIVPLLTGPQRIVHRVRLGQRRHFRPGRPAGRPQHGRRRRRCRHDTDHHISGRHHPGRPVRRSDESPWHGCGHRMCHRGGGDRPGAGVGCAGRMVHPVLRRHHLHGQRHREHGRGSPGLAPHRHLHPVRR